MNYFIKILHINRNTLTRQFIYPKIIENKFGSGIWKPYLRRNLSYKFDISKNGRQFEFCEICNNLYHNFWKKKKIKSLYLVKTISAWIWDYQRINENERTLVIGLDSCGVARYYWNDVSALRPCMTREQIRFFTQ